MTHGLKSSEGKFAAAGGRRWGQAWTFGVISGSNGTFGIYNGQNNVAQKYANKLLVNQYNCKNSHHYQKTAPNAQARWGHLELSDSGGFD